MYSTSSCEWVVGEGGSEQHKGPQSLFVEGLLEGVSCFYSFGEPLKTWTYAMLTCIVYQVILLYSMTTFGSRLSTCNRVL